MTLKEQVFAQAALLAGKLDEEKMRMLDALCGASTASLAARLREGLEPGDCRADFVASASLYALAALSEMDTAANMQQIQVGDVTMRPGGGSAAARCLRKQAELIMAPYLESTCLLRRA